MAARLATYFVPGAGIDREVITTDICRYLGPDALVKPGVYKDPKRGPNAQPESGFFVTAFRSLTTEQLSDIKADSARWAAERARTSMTRQNGGDGYRASQTRARQQDQPYSPNAATSYGQVQQPPAPMQQYDPYGRPYPQQPQYQQEYPQGGQQYPSTYGQPVQYGVSNPLQPRAPAPQTFQQAPAAGYPQGRGIDTGYGSLQDNRAQPDYYGSGLGRGQPMGQQPQYTTAGQYMDSSSSYPRGPTGGQAEDTAMDGYDNAYEDYTETTPAPPSMPGTAPPRHRERERDRDRDRTHERDEPRRDKHSRRR